MKIFKITDNKTTYSYEKNQYYFVGDDFWVKFFQGGNLDLVLYVNTFNKVKDKVSFSVKKEEYPEIYKLIFEMLQGIEKNKYLNYCDGKKIIAPEYKELFEKGYFSWQSDAPANEEDWGSSKSFLYNYFNIISMDNEYRLEFINNVKKEYFSIEVNTDRSRYGTLRLDVWDFFNKLKDTCKEISYDESRIILEKIWESINNKGITLISDIIPEEDKEKKNIDSDSKSKVLTKTLSEDKNETKQD